MAKKKTARLIKKALNRELGNTETSALDSVKYYENASQIEIPIKDVQDGIIQTRDGRYIGIVEVLPIDFKKKTDEEKNRITNTYKNLFARDDFKFSIKIMSDTSNPQELFKNIRKNCFNKEDTKIQEALDEYMEFVEHLGSQQTVTKRFFYIYEYRGENGKKDGEYNEIKRAMREVEESVISTMEACGNICVQPLPKDKNKHVIEILYTYFNRITSFTESVDDRYRRLLSDYKVFNEKTGKSKNIEIADLIAPKGLYFDNRNYIYMDGYFYGFLGVLGDSWPTLVNTGWMDFFDLGASVDVDLICKKLPQESTKLAIKGVNKLTRDKYKELARKRKTERAETVGTKFINNKKVYDRMNNGESLYDAGIVLTFRATSPQILSDNMYRVKRAYKRAHIQTDDSFLVCEEYFKLTMPFLYITKAFRLLKHNILTSQLATTYCYTTFEHNDPTGFVLGKEMMNNSIVAINNFNTQYYNNANIMLLGTSGAGKTHTQQLIGRRFYFNGIRSFFIIPKKGHEYRRGCEALNGAYIKLHPGSPHRINILEIRPEGEINEELLDDNTILQKGSWRSKKINNVILWIQLLCDSQITKKEFNMLNTGLVEIYESYGITEKNESIFEDIKTKKLKKMPIIEDVYEYCKKYEDLENIKEVLEIFVKGNCSNMNGQTNINIDNQYVVFDCDEDLIGETLLPSFLFIAFDHVYTEIKEKEKSRDIVFLDEVWKMLKTKDCAKQVQNMVKIVRGYGGSTIIATQEIADFLNAEEGFGKSVLSNSEITIVLKMKANEITLVKEYVKLTEEDCDKIIAFKRGQCMLISNGDKLSVSVDSTTQEKRLFSTDVNDRIA